MTSPGGPLLQSLSGCTEPHTSLRLSRDGKTLVSIGEGSEILVWDVPAGRVLRNIECPGRPAAKHSILCKTDSYESCCNWPILPVQLSPSGICEATWNTSLKYLSNYKVA